MIIAVVSVIIVLVLKKRRMMFRRNRSAEVDNSGLDGRKSETLSNQYEGFGTIGVDFTSTNFTNPIYQVVEQPKLHSRYCAEFKTFVLYNVYLIVLNNCHSKEVEFHIL